MRAIAGYVMAGAGVASALALAATAGSPAWGEAVVLVAVCSAVGALAVAATESLIGGGSMFGKRNESVSEEKRETGAGKECGPVRETAVPVKVAQDAAAVLAGIRSLIESLEITDRQTWERVASLAKEAEAALAEVQEAAERAGRAAGRAAEAFRGIAALVEGK